jgi:hypothetical protein
MSPTLTHEPIISRSPTHLRNEGMLTQYPACNAGYYNVRRWPLQGRPVPSSVVQEGSPLLQDGGSPVFCMQCRILECAKGLPLHGLDPRPVRPPFTRSFPSTGGLPFHGPISRPGPAFCTTTFSPPFQEGILRRKTPLRVFFLGRPSSPPRSARSFVGRGPLHSMEGPP